MRRLALEHMLERRHGRRCFIECDVRFAEEKLEIDGAAHVEELSALRERLEQRFDVREIALQPRGACVGSATSACAIAVRCSS